MDRLRLLVARLGRTLGPDSGAVVQSLVALLVSLVATLLAGLTLASAEARLAELPGLLLLVPAAIAQRGNVFGALGSRLGTSIHMGTFNISARPDTIFGQNVLAASGLSWVAAVWLALVATVLARVFGIADAMSLFEFVTVSVVGGVLASIVVLALTVALAAGSTRFGWDLDNVTAPLVTATGDLVTLPALIVGSIVVLETDFAPIIGSTVLAVAVILAIGAIRTRLSVMKRIVLESAPVLATASFLSLVAGAVVENRLGEFLAEPALLVLVPTYFGMAGALGGILSSRLGTKVHLGLVPMRALPGGPAWADIRTVVALAVPIFVLVGAGSHLGATLIDTASPGFVAMVMVALLAGVGAIVVVVSVAWFGTLAAVRFGIDPDTAAIPLTNSVLDLAGAFTLVAAILLTGVA